MRSAARAFAGQGLRLLEKTGDPLGDHVGRIPCRMRILEQEPVAP
jgi:hypothetical protein